MYALPWLWVGKSRLCFNRNYCRTCDHTLLTHTGCLGLLHTSKVCNTLDCEIILIDEIILSRETTFMGKLLDGLAPTGDSSGTADSLILKSWCSLRTQMFVSSCWLPLQKIQCYTLILVGTHNEKYISAFPGYARYNYMYVMLYLL